MRGKEERAGEGRGRKDRGWEVMGFQDGKGKYCEALFFLLPES